MYWGISRHVLAKWRFAQINDGPVAKCTVKMWLDTVWTFDTTWDINWLNGLFIIVAKESFFSQIGHYFLLAIRIQELWHFLTFQSWTPHRHDNWKHPKLKNSPSFEEKWGEPLFFWKTSLLLEERSFFSLLAGAWESQGLHACRVLVGS